MQLYFSVSVVVNLVDSHKLVYLTVCSEGNKYILQRHFLHSHWPFSFWGTHRYLLGTHLRSSGNTWISLGRALYWGGSVNPMTSTLECWIPNNYMCMSSNIDIYYVHAAKSSSRFDVFRRWFSLWNLDLMGVVGWLAPCPTLIPLFSWPNWTCQKKLTSWEAGC